MRSPFPSCATILLVLLSLVGAPSQAQEERTSSSTPSSSTLGAKETVLRVMQLSQELEKLLASLPPETQEDLRGQLIDRLTATANPAETSDSTAVHAPAETVPDAATSATTSATNRPRVADPSASSAPQPPTTTPSTVTTPAEPAPVTVASTDAGADSNAGMDRPASPPTMAPERSTLPETPTPAPSPATSADTERPTAVESTPPPLPSRRGCRTLVPFDSDGDGKLTGLDRFWRHFYLWTDVDKDRDVDEKELESPYERGIREVDVGLNSFVRGKGKRKRSLEILTERYILLDVGGDGWSGAPRDDDGALAVDATAIREVGGPDLRDSRGRAIEGIRPFEPGWILRVDGEEITANCPRN